MVSFQIAMIILISIMTAILLIFVAHQLFINRNRTKKHSHLIKLSTLLKWRKIRNKKIKEDLEIKKIASVNREIEKEIKKGE